MDSDGGGLELGLGLSLCRGGGGNEKTNVPSRSRILTAKDLPNGFSTTRAACLSGQTVGWPPVGSYRMNNLITQTKSAHEEEDKTNHLKPSKKFNNGSNYKSNQAARKDIIKAHVGFVKVNMDGLPIGRKVNLKAHICYETLAQATEDMFFKSSTKTATSSNGQKEEATKISMLLDGSSEFVLTYEDKDGDWMLVGDVPWGMFLSTVKRLRIMRTSEANGLAPRIPMWN